METIKKEEVENPKAFPCTDGKSFATDGMTLRDYFAAKAMQGIISIGTELKEGGISKLAYKTADAMLKQRQAIEKAL